MPYESRLKSLSSETVGLRSSGTVSERSVSVTPMASTITNRSFADASGVTVRRSSGSITRTPRPFICSKKVRLLTARMKKTHSSGLTSVPVAIMSTVTAMRGLYELRNEASNSSAFRAVCL